MRLREWDPQDKYEVLFDSRWEAVIAEQEAREERNNEEVDE
jgi:hypothetical protein